MGEIKKIGDEYYIEFYARGLLYQQKGGRTRQEAEKLLNEVEAKIKEGEMSILSRDVDIDIFLKTYFENAPYDHTYKSLQRFQEVAQFLVEYLSLVRPDINKLSELTPSVMQAYVQHLENHKHIKALKEPAKMVQLHLLLVSEILEFGITLGYINDNPMLHVKLENAPKRRKPEVLSLDERDKLLSAADEDLREILEVILCAGLRMEEVLRLDWADIDFDNNLIAVKSFKGRGQTTEERKIPMDAAVLGILMSRQSKSETKLIFQEFTEDELKIRVDRLLTECNIKKTFNCLRHTFAKAMLERQVGLVRLYKLMGIDDVAQVMMYSMYVPVRDELS